MAFWLAVLLTAGASRWTRVAARAAGRSQQTQGLLAPLPAELSTSWEAWVTRTLDQFPGMADLGAKLGAHPLVGPVSDYLSGRLPSLFGDVSKRVLSVVGAAVALLTVGVMSIYLALYPGVYREWLIALVPPVHRDLVRDVMNGLTERCARTSSASWPQCSSSAGSTAIGLAVIGVPVLADVWHIQWRRGTRAGVRGAARDNVAGTVRAWQRGGSTRALLVIGVGVLVHVVAGNLVSPLIMSKKVDLPPVLTIMAVLIAG